jgi:hypothetical protein
MTDRRRSLLARGWSVLERELGPRADELVATSEFRRAVGLVADVNALARRQAAAAAGRLWHLVNLPTGSDVARLRRQIGALDREVRRLTIQLERQAARDAAGNAARDPSAPEAHGGHPMG